MDACYWIKKHTGVQKMTTRAADQVNAEGPVNIDSTWSMDYGDGPAPLPPSTAPAVQVPMGEVAWLRKFINCVPFGADCPTSDIDRAHSIVTTLLRAAQEGK